MVRGWSDISDSLFVPQTSGLVYSGANNDTLQVFISAEQPSAGSLEYANWLPAPNHAPCEFILRTYKPPSYVLAGVYAAPAVVRTTTASINTPGE